MSTDSLKQQHAEALQLVCSLSPRQREAFELRMKGLRIKECAEVMGTSPDYVKEVLAAARRKIGVRNDMEAAVVLMEHRVLELEIRLSQVVGRQKVTLMPPEVSGSLA